MMPPVGGTRDDSQRPTRPSAPADVRDRDAPAALPQIFLETVNTLSAGDAGAPWHEVLSADDRRRLVDVLRGRGGRPHLDRALAIDLVAAVLPQALVAIADGVDAQRRLVEAIARSLLDDPRSVLRLEALIAAIQADGDGQGGATA